ncbi:hypothetical protein PC9H_001367 [Pleurotus ostreatus]|uniref:Uncharacterized protein n=1 Tax=Pleurotus ostreatus TaxID=5322 RepID=A0A8H7A3M8_PLEOS|nr:uncharacterized protein PC9H_001367 [Pleurotus ostreatus]KAF7441018.1 hypothetical protein PC9H_001367 [Pleurotus ostreatus]
MGDMGWTWAIRGSLTFAPRVTRGEGRASACGLMCGRTGAPERPRAEVTVGAGYDEKGSGEAKLEGNLHGHIHHLAASLLEIKSAPNARSDLCVHVCEGACKLGTGDTRVPELALLVLIYSQERVSSGPRILSSVHQADINHWDSWYAAKRDSDGGVIYTVPLLVLGPLLSAATRARSRCLSPAGRVLAPRLLAVNAGLIRSSSVRVSLRLPAVLGDFVRSRACGFESLDRGPWSSPVDG